MQILVSQMENIQRQKEIYTMLDDYEESHNKVLECAYYIAKGII